MNKYEDSYNESFLDAFKQHEMSLFKEERDECYLKDFVICKSLTPKKRKKIFKVKKYSKFITEIDKRLLGMKAETKIIEDRIKEEQKLLDEEIKARKLDVYPEYVVLYENKKKNVEAQLEKEKEKITRDINYLESEKNKIQERIDMKIRSMFDHRHSRITYFYKCASEYDVDISVKTITQKLLIDEYDVQFLRDKNDKPKEVNS